MLGILLIGEYLVYFIFAMSWNIPVEKSDQDLRVLIMSDPQVQVKNRPKELAEIWQYIFLAY